MGRPKIENPKSKCFSIRLETSMNTYLEMLCKKHNLSKGEIIRRSLAQYLDSREDNQ